MSKGARGPLEYQAAGTVPEKRADPLDQVQANPLSAEERKKGGRLYVVEASFPIEEESGDLVAEKVEGFMMVL